MRLFAALLLVLIACAGCQVKPATPTGTLVRENREQLRAKLKTITLADGVSQSEAEIIGAAYFARHVGCGAFFGVHDGGNRWVVDAAFGYAGETVKGFYIYKNSGKVVSPIGPNYDNPLDILP